MSNLYVCGNGVAVTRLVLQRYNGGAWQNATQYEHTKKHRFRIQVKNYFDRGNVLISASDCGRIDIHVAALNVHLNLDGARFEGGFTPPSQGGWNLMPRQVDAHPDFNDTIAPQMTRWFEFGTFTWTKPTVAVSHVIVGLRTFHRFIAHNTHPDWGNVVAAGA